MKLIASAVTMPAMTTASSVNPQAPARTTIALCQAATVAL